MAYHLSVSTISRGKGRSAAGACAYVCAGVAVDDYTGDKQDYRRKAKPVSVTYLGTDARTPQDFAYALDTKETRKNSVVAREVILALPNTIPPAMRQEIAEAVAAWVSARYDVPALCVVHKPSRDGDQRNHHAHIIIGTRNSSGEKVRALDDRKRGSEEITQIRAYASALICARVQPNELGRWSHLSLSAQGLSRDATRHEGPMVTALRRKGHSPTLLSAAHNDEVRTTTELKAATDTQRHLTATEANEARRRKFLAPNRGTTSLPTPQPRRRGIGM